MTEFKVGDKVRIKDTHPTAECRGEEFTITEIRPAVGDERGFGVWLMFLEHLEPGLLDVHDAVEHPNYYVMPDGHELYHISKWLNSAGAQAVQYIVRSTRIDGVVKDRPEEDLRKAIFWLNVELERLESLDGRA